MYKFRAIVIAIIIFVIIYWLFWCLIGGFHLDSVNSFFAKPVVKMQIKDLFIVILICGWLLSIWFKNDAN